jgi:hypothetical protein
VQFGFFLHPERFRDAALLRLPFGDKRRPSPALLCVSYLWGVHLSKSPALACSADLFLRCAQRHIASETSGHSQPTNALHIIQAQVLLAAYLFRNNELLEAEVHATGAATLALRYRLHKIRSARPPRSEAAVLLDVHASRPRDAIEEGERIRGFWAVVTLQTSLALALSSTCNIIEAAGTEIDAPWPLELADYAAGVLPPEYIGQESVRHLLMDDPFPSSPLCMLHAKASVLLYHVSQLPRSGQCLLSL